MAVLHAMGPRGRDPNYASTSAISFRESVATELDLRCFSYLPKIFSKPFELNSTLHLEHPHTKEKALPAYHWYLRCSEPTSDHNV